MKNKKIVFSIIIVLIAIFGIVGVNALNKNLISKSNTKDEVLLSDDTKENNTNDDEKKEDEAKVKKDNENSKSEDKKKEEYKENKEKTTEETFNNDGKKDTTNQSREKSSEVKSEEFKNRTIDKSKTTKNNNNDNNKKTTKNHQDNKSKATTENEAKKQTIELSIIDGVKNKTLFCGQLPLNENENFNTIMNKFFSNNGVRHINRGGYISMMYGLAEFNKGSNSGWCYYVNGNKASVGISGYTPKNGDRVVWKYLKDGLNN